MHRIPRAAAALAALGLAAPAPLAAQQPASVQVEDALQTLDWLGQILLNAGMMAARSAADLTYESIELEKRSGGTITLVGLTVHPESNPMFPNMGWPEDAPECVITVERLEYAGLLAKWDGSGQSGAISLVGIDAPFTCLERGPASMLQGVGFDALRFERGEITYDYDYSTSALAASVTLSAPGAADIRIDADFDYAWVSDRRRGARSGPQPTLILDSADIRIDDRGGLEKARPILAQQGMSPEAVQAIVTGQLTGLFAQGGQPSPEQMELAASSGAAVGAFLAQGGALVVSADPEAPVKIGPNPPGPEIVAMLSPKIERRAAQDAAASVDVAMLGAAIDYGAAWRADNSAAPTLSVADSVAVAEALASGVGAPYAPDQAMLVVDPFVSQSHPAACRVAAAVQAEDKPEAAYAAALCGWGDADSAADPKLRAQGVAMLDQLEKRVPLMELLKIQGSADPVPTADELAQGPAALRKMAFAAAEGRGVTRDYQRAYLLAVLAAADGDLAANALRKRLDARLSGLDREAWLVARGGLEQAAFDAWKARAGQ